VAGGARKDGSRSRLGEYSLGCGESASCFLLFGLAWVAATDDGSGNASSEYQVKAAFLYHFAQFVDWPEETFKDASSR